MMDATTNLLATKLYIPRLRSSIIARPRLLERLDQGLKGKLTLISALPGSGKTTLVSEWWAARDFPLAWISLEESDNDATRFWSYVVRAIETLAPGVSDDVLAFLQSFPAPSIESVLISLMNAIDSSVEGEFALVLDDYHCIETEAIHTALTFLLDHLPTQMHIILITRVDPPLPLARFRVRGQLTEIHTTDIRFTPAEASAYFNETMNLHLSREEAEQLTEQTEGWIAGLQLAALSLQGQEDTTAFLDTFNGNHRYVLAYLTQEVLDQQPDYIQRFLQETALLHRFSASLCDAVTGRTDSQNILHRLDSANLFLISLDQEQQWYRYHSLFRDFLLRSLRETQSDVAIYQLHQRAARWYEEREVMNEAINHLLASQQFPQAAHLIERIARSEWMSGHALTLQCWLRALPAELLHSRPQLLLFYAWSLIASNQIDQTQQRLVEAISALEGEHSDDDSELWAEILILQATLARFQQDAARTIELSQQAVRHLPLNNAVLQSINTLNLGHAYRLRGEIGAASETFQQAMTLARTVHNTYIVLLSFNNLIELHVEQGMLHSAAHTSQESYRFAASHGCQQLPIMSQTYVKEGEVFYQWNKLNEAAERIKRGIALGQSRGNIRFLLQGYMTQARLLTAEGKQEQGQHLLLQAAHISRDHHSSQLSGRIAALQARLWLAVGQFAPAYSWLEQSPLRIGDSPEYQYEYEYLTMVRVLLAQGKAKEVDALLERLRQAAQQNQRVGVLIEIFLLQALASNALSMPEEAYTALERALSLAEPEGYIRLFLDEGNSSALLLTQFLQWEGNIAERIRSYAHVLLAQFTDYQSPLQNILTPRKGDIIRQNGNIPYIEPLGEREREVLSYLAVGLSNQAIAEEMVVALSTVKSHLKSIYRKLGADSRTHAIARARELRLL